MTRKRRVWVPNFYYHVVSRGNRREALFRDPGDYKTFLYILYHVHKKYPLEIASYCLMTNHYHLLMKSPEESISKVMSLVNKRYANYYNNKNNLSGHVFEKRYYDDPVISQRSLLNVSRYIHLNPVRANMVKSPEEYRWSSLKQIHKMDFSQDPLRPYLNLDPILELFPGNKKAKIAAYYEYLRLEDEEIESNKGAI